MSMQKGLGRGKWAGMQGKVLDEDGGEIWNGYSPEVGWGRKEDRKGEKKILRG